MPWDDPTYVRWLERYECLVKQCWVGKWAADPGIVSELSFGMRALIVPADVAGDRIPLGGVVGKAFERSVLANEPQWLIFCAEAKLAGKGRAPWPIHIVA
ncbi:hypothetical protein GCM10029976_066380 [Kribbella albertanoniae]